jgi:hypothetical protein
MRSRSADNLHRPEDELLLCLPWQQGDEERATRRKEILRSGIDWSYLFQTASQHGLMSLVYHTLQKNGSREIPEGISGLWQQAQYTHTLHTLFLTGQLIKIVHFFEDHGISSIPYKGPALAADLYGDLVLRPFIDLDILIPRQAVLKARDLLVTLGYRPHFALKDTEVAAYQKAHYELIFSHERQRSIVELKWDVTDTFFSLPTDYEALWERRKPVRLAEREILALSPEDTLLVLSIHGAKHLWTRLLWIYDVARLLHVHQDLDWQWVLKSMDSRGGRRILFLGLSLAHTLLGAPLPADLEKKIRSDSAVQRLTRSVGVQLFRRTSNAVGLWETSLFHLKARERLRDRVRYCCRFAMTLTPGDWSVFPLPKLLFPLYYVVRPLRLLKKYGLRPLVETCKGYWLP